MRQASRQKLYSFLNWAVQRGNLKPIYAPPATLPEVLKPKRIGYASVMRRFSSCLTTCLKGKCMIVGGLPSSSAPFTAFVPKSCATYASRTGQTGQNCRPSIKGRWVAPKTENLTAQAASVAVAG